MKGRGTQLPTDLEIYWDVFSGNHDRLYFLGLQNHCTWWLQPWKVVTNLDSISKSRDITLLTKVHLVKAMVLPVVMYRCQSWTIKKAECQRIDAFELWCWRRLLRVPWTARRSNQSILKVFIGRSDAKAETPILWPPHGKSWLIGKDSDAGRDWGQEEKGMTEDEMAGWHHPLHGHESEWTLGVGDGQRPGVLRFMGSQSIRHDWATEMNWTERKLGNSRKIFTSVSLTTLKP